MHGIDKVSQICILYIKLSTHISMINHEKNNKGVFRHKSTAYILWAGKDISLCVWFICCANFQNTWHFTRKLVWEVYLKTINVKNMPCFHKSTEIYEPWSVIFFNFLFPNILQFGKIFIKESEIKNIYSSYQSINETENKLLLLPKNTIT